MAKLIIHLRVEDADSPQQALGLAQEVWAMLQCRLKGTPHRVTGKVTLLCPDCGKPMTVQDREIVCPACISEWERDFRLDDVAKRVAREREHGPQQSLEALLM